MFIIPIILVFMQETYDLRVRNTENIEYLYGNRITRRRKLR